MVSSHKNIIQSFLLEVRSGKNPDATADYIADSVRAHQVASEAPVTVVRTPAEYAEHVREMKAEYGDFDFEIEELIAEGDRVYARWNQLGNGIRQFTSCVYRLENGLIVEYWIQIDRLGLEIQKGR